MFHFVVTLLTVNCFSQVLGQDVPQGISDSLMILIREEASIRVSLEHDLNELEAELNTLSALQNNLTCGCAGQHAPVAFSATLTKDISSLGTRQQVPFDHVITNIGNAYDSRHGEFRAPVDGTYEFTVSMYVQSGQWMGLEIVKDGTTVAAVRSGDSSTYTMGGTSVVLELAAGQDVWVDHIAESDNNHLLGQSFTSFSGHLIQMHA